MYFVSLYHLFNCHTSGCWLQHFIRHPFTSGHLESPLNNSLFLVCLQTSSYCDREVLSCWNFTVVSHRQQQLSLQQLAVCLSKRHSDTCTSKPWASQELHLSCRIKSEGGENSTVYRHRTDYDNSLEDITRNVKMPKLLFSRIRFYEIKDLMQNVKRPRR